MTDRVVSETRISLLEALARLTGVVAHAKKVEEICEAALDALEQAIGAKRAAVLLFDDHRVMTFRASRGLSEEYRRIAAGHSPWTPEDLDATPIFVRDVRTDASLEGLSQAFRDEDVRALAFIPLKTARRVIGKFMLYRSEPHDFTGDELEASLGIAERVGLGVERLSAEAALRTSRDELDAIFRSITDGITVIGRDGKFLFANPAAARMIGAKSVEEVLSEGVAEVTSRFEIFDENGVQLAASDLPGRRALSGEVSSTRVVRFRFQDAHEDRWSRISASPIFGPDGSLQMAVSVFRDITDSRMARERERFLDAAGGVLASSLDYETTLESVARLAVPTIADWIRIDIANEGGGFRKLIVVHKDPARQQWADEMEQRFARPQEGTMQARIIATGKSELYSEITDDMLKASIDDPEYLEAIRSIGLRSVMAVPLPARGRIVGVLTFIASETAGRYHEADLKFAEDLGRSAAIAIDNAVLFQHEQASRVREAEARAAAEAASRAKDDFLATVSHELRTPLTAILGWSRMLTTATLDEQSQGEGLKSIASAAEAQARIIDDLLDVAGIAAGKVSLDIQNVSLPDVVARAMSSVSHAALARQITLHVDAEDLRMKGDPDRLQQVFWNLLANAVKFTPAGGDVWLTTERAGDILRVIVRDSGAGMSAELLPFVFERFRQGDSRATREFGGLGLGLSIVRSLVEMHGGRVAAASAGLDQGSTFTVTLPLIAGSDDAVDSRARGRRLQGRRILLVEDDRETRQFLVTLLRTAGAEVRAADGVQAAMIELDGWTPQVLVTDIAMPQKDGYAMLEAVRNHPSTKEIPAIAVTAYGRPEDRDRALDAGFVAYIRKPVDADALIEALYLATPVVTAVG